VTVSDVGVCEVATDGRPVEALVAAISARRLAVAVEPGSVNVVEVAHDLGCPCTSNGRSMDACECETVVVTWRRVA